MTDKDNNYNYNYSGVIFPWAAIGVVIVIVFLLCNVDKWP